MATTFRLFRQNTGWGEWTVTPVDGYGFSDSIARDILETSCPDFRDLDTSEGFSLTQTNDLGVPDKCGVAMVRHKGGIVLLEYKWS